MKIPQKRKQKRKPLSDTERLQIAAETTECLFSEHTHPSTIMSSLWSLWCRAREDTAARVAPCTRAAQLTNWKMVPLQKAWETEVAGHLGNHGDGGFVTAQMEDCDVRRVLMRTTNQ